LKTACFTGHRPPKINSENEAFIRTRLSEVIGMLVGEGCTHFISGMALGVDMLAAEIVLEMRRSNPGITLECAIPCRTQAQRWTREQRARYAAIQSRAQKVTILSESYTPWCMQFRNAYMVDASDCVIAVFDGSAGGTANTVAYAKKKNRRIVIINPEGGAVND